MKLIPQFEAELSKPIRRNNDNDYDSQESVEPYEFASFADDFVPFIAKNQFKS